MTLDPHGDILTTFQCKRCMTFANVHRIGWLNLKTPSPSELKFAKIATDCDEAMVGLIIES